jgi:hypothetical protein
MDNAQTRSDEPCIKAKKSIGCDEPRIKAKKSTG